MSLANTFGGVLTRRVRPPLQVMCARTSYDDLYVSKEFIKFEGSIDSPKPRTKAGGQHMVTLAPGVGIGTELCQSLMDVFSCVGAPVNFEVMEGVHESDLDFRNMIHSIRRNGVAIKGDIDGRTRVDPYEKYRASRNWHLRRLLDLYVSVVECKSLPVKATPVKTDFDVVVIRQNTEGVFALLDHAPTKSLVENLGIYTRYNCLRIAEFSFKYVKRKKRSKISLLHSASTMPMSEGLLIQSFKTVAERYPDVRLELLEISGGFKKFLINPKSMDVVVSNSLYAGTFTYMLLGILGGPGFMCGQNIGEKYRVYEPAARSKGTSLVGKNIANPHAMIMCGVAVLEELGHQIHADIIRYAVRKTIVDDRVLTFDLGGKATTKEFTNNVVLRIRDMTGRVLCSYDPAPKPLAATEKKDKTKDPQESSTKEKKPS